MASKEECTNEEKTTRELAKQARLSAKDKAILCERVLRNLAEYYDRTYRLSDAMDAMNALGDNSAKVEMLIATNAANRKAYTEAADLVKKAFKVG